jgi:type I restriction enzyme, S subunit
MLTEAGVNNGSRLVERDTLLFVVRGMSLVKEFRVGIADVPLAFGQDCKALIAKSGILPLFLAFAVITMADEIQGMVELAGHGTGKLSTDRLKAIAIPRPPEPLQAAFVETVSPLREAVTRLRLSKDRLEAIRALILPKLLNGQVEVSSLNLDTVLESVA